MPKPEENPGKAKGHAKHAEGIHGKFTDLARKHSFTPAADPAEMEALIKLLNQPKIDAAAGDQLLTAWLSKVLACCEYVEELRVKENLPQSELLARALEGLPRILGS